MGDFLIWWQHLPEHMNPVIFEIGSFKLQYYGLMYIVALPSPMDWRPIASDGKADSRLMWSSSRGS